MAARTGGARLAGVSTTRTRASSLRHVRPVEPLHFPEQEPDEERMGQGRRHLHLCWALWTCEEKLRRYRALGVGELVTFHLDAEPGQRLRVWDRIEQDLVERVVTEDRTPCVTLGMTLLVGAVDEYPVGPRIARDVDGLDLVRTAKERTTRAEARVAELERELELASDGRKGR